MTTWKPMGLHMMRADRAAIDYCREVKPAVMKWFDEYPDDIIQECRKVSPGTIHIARLYCADQSLSNHGAFAKKVAAEAARHRGTIHAWELYNEYYTDNAGELRSFMRSEVEGGKRINDAGVGALIGGFSTGRLDEPAAAGGRAPLPFHTTTGENDPFYNACRDAGAWKWLHDTRGTNALMWHEYMGYYVGYMVITPDGKNQWDHARNAFTGWSTNAEPFWNPKVKGYLFPRYRFLWDKFRRDGFDIRGCITESWLDDVNPRPGGQGKGWRDWMHVRGPLGDPIAGAGWVAWQVSQDDYMWGITGFGDFTRDPQWNSFDMSLDPTAFARHRAIQANLAKLRPGPVPPVPVPEPPPVPPTTSGVQPRIMAVTGDGWTALARRALMREPKVAEVAQMKAANGGAAIKAGQWYLSPFHKVARV